MATDPANATLTVALNGKTVVIELDGDELSRASSDGIPYLGNASRAWIAERVEAALLELTKASAA